MGWKSTVDLSRSEAKRLIRDRYDTLDDLSNEELEEIIEGMGYGDDPNLDYFGHNFWIKNDDDI